MKNYNLIDFDRQNEEHIAFMEKVFFANYANSHMIDKLERKTLEKRILNPEHYQDDFSKIIIANNKFIGMFNVTRPEGNNAWELGMFHIMPNWQKKGIGSAVLDEIGTMVKNSPFHILETHFFSPRTIANSIPASRGDVLHFFTKRGYQIKDDVEGTHLLSKNNFSYDKDRLNKKISSNIAEGYSVRNVKYTDSDYEGVRQMCIDACRGAGQDYWADKCFDADFSAGEREGLSIVVKDGKAVSLCGYTLSNQALTGHAYAYTWGPMLTIPGHEGRGLAAWIIRDSLEIQFANGADFVNLWAEVGGGPAKMYEKFGFHLHSAWFMIYKDFSK